MAPTQSEAGLYDPPHLRLRHSQTQLLLLSGFSRDRCQFISGFFTGAGLEVCESGPLQILVQQGPLVPLQGFTVDTVLPLLIDPVTTEKQEGVGQEEGTGDTVLLMKDRKKLRQYEIKCCSCSLSPGTVNITTESINKGCVRSELFVL